MDLSYPIGEFEAPVSLDSAHRREWLRQLAEAAQIEVNTAAAVQTPESPKTESPQVEQVQESV